MSKIHPLLHDLSILDIAKLRKVFPHIESNINKLELIQGHRYKERKLAALSLIHRSALVYWPMDKTGVFSNERLEFLGDAFLSFFIAYEAMISHSSLQEGELSRLRAAIVGTLNLAEKSRILGIGDCLLVGNTEINVDLKKRNNVLADAFEAVSAALLLDAGEDKARKWLLSVFAKDLSERSGNLLKFDAKSRVQQWTQSIIGAPPFYKVVETINTPQEILFTVAVYIGDKEIERAQAANKRDASKAVAEKMIQKIDSGELTKDMILNFSESKK